MLLKCTALARRAGPDGPRFPALWHRIGSFELQLNKIESQKDGCLAIFKATNRLGMKLNKTLLQIYVLDQSGAVLNNLGLDFQSIQPGKAKFVKFNLPQNCENISKLHPNGFTECVGDKDMTQQCSDGLKTSNLTKIGFSDTDP